MTETVLDYIFGIFGLMTGLIGMWFSFITYSSPMVRFRWYLKRKKNGKKSSLAPKEKAATTNS